MTMVALRFLRNSVTPISVSRLMAGLAACRSRAFLKPAIGRYSDVLEFEPDNCRIKKPRSTGVNTFG